MIRNKGFTLLEVILTFVILTIIIGIAIPNFSRSFYGFSLTQKVRQLTYLMNYAQMQAIKKKKIYALDFDGYRTFQLKESDPQGLGNKEVYGVVKSRFARPLVFPDNVDVKCDQTRVEFYPNGTIMPVTMHIKNNKQSLTISTRHQRNVVHLMESK